MRMQWSVLAVLAGLSAGVTAWAQGAVAAPAIKPAIAGLISMEDISFHRVDGGVPENALKDIDDRPGLMSAVVINITWAQLQPKPSVLDTSALDAALAHVRAYNKRYPKTPVRVVLRQWPGPNAPQWAKNLAGPPVTIIHRGMPETVGRYWTPVYRAAWRALQDQLGAKYDSEPLIAMVTNVTGSSMTDEPLLLSGDEVAVKNLLAAGFTDAQYKQTLWESPEDYRAWKTTIIEQPYNPFRTIDSGKPVVDDATTIELMHHWREVMGARGLIGNHSLAAPPVESHIFLWNEIKKLGQPIEFQTQSPAGLNWDATVQYAVSLGSPALEIWSGKHDGEFSGQSSADLLRWSAELKANMKQ